MRSRTAACRHRPPFSSATARPRIRAAPDLERFLKQQNVEVFFGSCYSSGMSVTVELPGDIEERLRQENPNLDSDAKEAYAVELFRQGKLNHFQLSRVLGVDRFATDAVLKRHQVEEQSFTSADLESDRNTLRKVLDEAPR